MSVNLDPPPLVWNGKAVDILALHLNTALALGSDAVCLTATIAALCEAHGYIMGEDRSWAAAILEAGLAEGSIRAGNSRYDGWQAVITRLRAATSDPVVMSYSVSEPFPNRGHWDKAFAALSPSLRIHPAGLRERYVHGLSAIDLISENWQERLNATFPLKKTSKRRQRAKE